MKHLLLVFAFLIPVCLSSQSKQDRKAIQQLLESGVITPQESEIMSTRASIESTPSSLEEGGFEDEELVSLFEKYLEAKGLNQPAQLSSTPAPSDLSLGGVAIDFVQILEGFIPFALDFFSRNDVPCNLCVFKWAKFGKDQYRSNPEIRALF